MHLGIIITSHAKRKHKFGCKNSMTYLCRRFRTVAYRFGLHNKASQGEVRNHISLRCFFKHYAMATSFISFTLGGNEISAQKEA